MSDPVLHVKFEYETFDHRPKNGERFSLSEELLLVLCLNLTAPINWQLN